MPLVARGAPAHPELPHPLGSPFPPSTVAGRADVIGVAKIGVAHRVRAQLSKASRDPDQVTDRERRLER